MTTQKAPKLKLFLVDDAPEILSGLAELLTADGCCEVVGSATSEQLAIDWSLHHEAAFDVALVDLLLQDGSGFAVLAHLVKYQPGKVIVLSEYASGAIAQRCLNLGAAAAFRKSEMAECVAFIRGLRPEVTGR